MKQAFFWILVLTCILSTGSVLMSVLTLGTYYTSYYTFIAACISGGIIYLMNHSDKTKDYTKSRQNISIPESTTTKQNSNSLQNDVTSLINSRQVINLPGNYHTTIDEIQELPDSLILIKLSLMTKYQLNKANKFLGRDKWLEAEGCQLHIKVDGEDLPFTLSAGQHIKAKIADFPGGGSEEKLVVVSISGIDVKYELETCEYDYDGSQVRHFGS